MKKRLLSIFLAMCLIVTSTFSMSVSAASNNFTDISNHWAKVYINYVCNTKEVMEGFDGSTTTFSPNTTLSRADLAMIMGKVCGIKLSEWQGATKFTDVSTSSRYCPYIKWASEMGIITGNSSTTFAPANPIKRQDAAVLLYRYITKYNIPVSPSGSYPNFTDQSSISSYATAAVKFVVQAGLMGGSGSNFNPQKTITRAEIATMVYNLYVRYLSKEAYSNRTVNIVVGTTNSFYKEHSSTNDIRNYLSNAQLPFTNRWNISFNPTYQMLSDLPEDGCSKWNSLCDNSCGTRCVDNTSQPNHHKNWYWNFYHVWEHMPYPGKAFRVAATSAYLCDHIDGGKHNHRIAGLTAEDLSMVYLAKANGANNIRIIQHELSHLYGPDDGKCSTGVLCIMSGGFDFNTTYNLQNIWCPGCSNSFTRTAQ